MQMNHYIQMVYAQRKQKTWVDWLYGKAEGQRRPEASNKGAANLFLSRFLS
jgi:hypothetical protein